MFRAHVLIISRSKLHYTASGFGIITPIGVMIPNPEAGFGIITPIGVMIPNPEAV